MTPELRIAAVIPARMAASRYPGKPLLTIAGLPMIEHVRRRALLSKQFVDVVVATCDEEIASVVRGHGGRVILTSDAHRMATDRVAEATQKLDCTHVVNIQGDEILVSPQDLEKMIEKIKINSSGAFWNGVGEISNPAELGDVDIVKCIISLSGRIMYCARDLSVLGTEKEFSAVRKVLGILGYTKAGLIQYGSMSRTPIEISQSIDQSRILEHDEQLNGVEFSNGYPGINTPREEVLVRHILKQDKSQIAILRDVMQMRSNS